MAPPIIVPRPEYPEQYPAVVPESCFRGKNSPKIDPPSHDSKVKTKQRNERWLCRVQDLLQNH